MGWVEDISTILVGASVGVVNTNIFYSSKANVPTKEGPYLSIIPTSGTGHQRTHNTAPQPAYQFPGAQIVVRSSAFTPAMNMARAAYVALAGVKNEFINTVWYREIRPLQEPYDLGLDDTGRIVIAFNVLGDKAP